MASSIVDQIARPISSALSAPLNSDDYGKLNALGLIGPSEPAAPTNASAPFVYGHDSDGSTLTSTPGSWRGYPAPTYAYQWKADATNVGSNQNTYVTQAGDIGKSITCTVTATNTEGSAAQASNGITVTTSAAPANTVAPVVSGSQPSGSTMTTTDGTWTANPDVDTYSYQWKADAGNVGTNQATYVTQAGDVGKSITCTVTATNRKGSAAQASNGITVTAALTVPANTVAPVVSGAQIVGSTMTSTTGTWTGNPSPTYSYQWKSAGTNVGTDQNTYVSQASDASKSITCVVTATNSQGSTAQSSNGISMSALAAPANTVAPAISGDTGAGSTLTSTTGTWTGNPTPTYAYQWKADGTNVGTNQNTYVTQEGEIDSSITCTVTATNSQGSASQASNGITVTSSAWDTSAWFAASEQGMWYDPNDLSTLFQNKERTIPVTAATQPVRCILDKSGNENHLYQYIDGGSHPAVLGVDSNGCYYIDCVGSDSCFTTESAISLSGKNKATVLIGAKKGPETDAAVLMEYSENVINNNGSFGFFTPLITNNKDVYVYYKGTSYINVGIENQDAIGANGVFWSLMSMDGSAGTLQGTIRDVSAGSASGAGSANFGSHKLFVGARSGRLYQFYGRIYGIIVRFEESSENDKYDANMWMHSKTYPFITPVPFANSLDYNKVEATDVNGQAMMVMVPNTNGTNPLDVRLQPKVIVYNRGMSETQDALIDDSLKSAVVSALIDEGYILCGSNANGNNFGNAASLASYKNLYDYVKLKFNPSGFAVWGQSMGGFSAANIINNSIFPCKGALFTYPMLNLLYEHTSGGYISSIDTAYGITGTSPNTYAEKTSGKDPCIYGGSSYSGIRMRFYASSSDTAVSKSNNTDTFAAIVGSYVPESTVVVCSGDHGDSSHFVPSEYVSFFGRCFS